MRAITLWQPWSSLVAAGVKRWETRSWPTSYRGVLAIHAGGHFTAAERSLCLEEPFRSALFGAGPADPDALPLGAFVAVARLAGCRRMEGEHARLPGLALRPWWRDLDPRELACGDYREGRYGWLLADVVKLLQPIPFPGSRGLWRVPPAVLVKLPAGRPALESLASEAG